MSFKFCPMCGEKVTNESFKFCPECGYKFEVVDEPVENNSLENVNEQNIKNPPEEIGEDDGLAKNPKLRQRQLELMRRYGKRIPGEKTEGQEDDELKRWIAQNRVRVQLNDSNKQSELRRKNLERKRQEGLKKREEEKNTTIENSRSYGAFQCHYSEQRYNALIGVHPEFFKGICKINENSLIIKGKKRQKIIRYSNISSIEYNKKLIGQSHMVITLSGGNIINLTIAQEAYNIINRLWQGNY